MANKTVTVRIGAATLHALRKLAKREGRSVPMQLDKLLEGALSEAPKTDKTIG